MRTKKFFAGLLFMGMVSAVISGAAQADPFKIAIMQDKKGAAKKYTPLLNYLKKNGIDGSFVGTKNYDYAAKMFASGKVDAMFSGSGVAGTMIIKEVAYPLVRPVDKKGNSTYWAVVIAPKGSSTYSQNADYYSNKKVIFCSLASSGEFYFRSISGSLDVGATMEKAASHGAAIDALSKEMADVAIVKNRVWDKVQSKYSNLMLVGKDDGENPNDTLIISRKVNNALAEKVKVVLLALQDDPSAEAQAVRDSLGIQGYIVTTKDDFKHTIYLLKRAGVSKYFNFVF